MKATDKCTIVLKLNQQQFRDAIRCTLNHDGYVEILKLKGPIGEE